MSTNATRRAAIVWLGAFPAAAAVASTMRASSPPVSTVHWDQALERYLEAREAYEEDLKHGALRRVYDRHAAGDDPFTTVSEAEEVHHATFGSAREKALHGLLLTAAPTYLALRQKVWIAQSELIEVAGDDDRPILGVIADDLTRLVAP